MSLSLRVGPPSPPSPRTGLQKEYYLVFLPSDHIPQTPKSPPLMSISAQYHASSFTTQNPPSQATPQSQSANLALPPSTPLSKHTSQQNTVTTHSIPTPASSESGRLVSSTTNNTDHVKGFMSTEKQETQIAATIERNMTLLDQTEHRRTNHERHMEDVKERSQEDAVETKAQGNSWSVDAMDVDDKVPETSGGDYLSLESLQRDFSAPFHLCKQSFAPTGPDPALDLISVYGLGSVVRSVARIDPVTGEKINRLRKSYEGKLKGLGLSGRNKPVKHELGTPGGLRHLTMWPEEEWQNQKVYGKEIKLAEVDSDLEQLQMRAVKLEPGAVPNNEYWEDVLGHEKLSSKHPGLAALGKKPVVSAGTPRPVAQPNGAPTAVEPERTRTTRGRKRHYDDNSFVGYGEGYADDDDEGAFYSTGEGGKKKRKKDHISKVSTPVPEPGGSYGVGMYGIGAR